MILDVKIFDPNEFKVFTFDINKVDVKIFAANCGIANKIFWKELYPSAELL